MAGRIKRLIEKIPPIRRMKDELGRLENENQRLHSGFVFAEPGHFNSPIPDQKAVFQKEDRIWSELPDSLPGIDLNTDKQLRLLELFRTYSEEMSFPSGKTEPYRYYFENNAYGYEDGTYLFCMIRHLQPKRIIEVGSGFSSCLTLDTNERFFNNSIDCTFIEPYPEFFKSKLHSTDFERIKIHESKLEEVPLSVFQPLKANDILFIDSSHVSKIGSDVNYIIHEILPSLNKGVFIHIHDVGYPFEYPKKWIQEGRAWNENYLLRAFLQYNSDFKITLFSSYLRKKHEAAVRRNLPIIFKGVGASIWLEKVS